MVGDWRLAHRNTWPCHDESQTARQPADVDFYAYVRELRYFHACFDAIHQK
jgi:hypothetical protein